MSKLKLSSPWATYYRQIKALFGDDPEILAYYDEDNAVIKLFVDNAIKADAIAKLLPTQKAFGNVTVNVSVIPSNKTGSSIAAPGTIFDKAFEGNPAFCFTRVVQAYMTNPITYVVFKNKVVQFFNDNLGSIYGLESTLYEDIAREILEGVSGACYCTEAKENLGAPLGEWP